jgi:hypothetical protein
MKQSLSRTAGARRVKTFDAPASSSTLLRAAPAVRLLEITTMQETVMHFGEPRSIEVPSFIGDTGSYDQIAVAHAKFNRVLAFGDGITEQQDYVNQFTLSDGPHAGAEGRGDGYPMNEATTAQAQGAEWIVFYQIPTDDGIHLITHKWSRLADESFQVQSFLVPTPSAVAAEVRE